MGLYVMKEGNDLLGLIIIFEGESWGACIALGLPVSIYSTLISIFILS